MENLMYSKCSLRSIVSASGPGLILFYVTCITEIINYLVRFDTKVIVLKRCKYD